MEEIKIGYRGGKIKVLSDTKPTGLTYTVVQKPTWIIGPSNSSENPWVGTVGSNYNPGNRSDELRITVETNEDPRYDGQASVPCAWTITQYCPGNPDIGVYIAVDAQSHFPEEVTKLDFALSTSNDTNHFVCTSSLYTNVSYTQSIEMCRYTDISSENQPLYLFYKADGTFDSEITFRVGIGSGPKFTAWFPNTEQTGSADPITFTKNWNTTGESVSVWNEGIIDTCPIYFYPY